MLVMRMVVRMRTSSAMSVRVGGFEVADEKREQNSQQQGKGQPHPVMRMKLNFRQQIAERYAQKHAC